MKTGLRTRAGQHQASGRRVLFGTTSEDWRRKATPDDVWPSIEIKLYEIILTAAAREAAAEVVMLVGGVQEAVSHEAGKEGGTAAEP